MNRGALDGVRIIGFTHFAQGPLSLQMLGDLGADIINIERPEGETERTILKSEKLGGEGPYFLAMNRNRRNLSLNLKSPEAKEIVKKLLKDADVVVSNFRAGVLDKLGFGYEEVKKINPGIIYAEASGYGSSGPYAKRPGQDILAQCVSGYATLAGTRELPVPGGAYLVDAYSSLLLTIGIISALYERDMHGGEGQKIDVNLLDSAIHMQQQEFVYYMNTGEVLPRAERVGSHIQMQAPYGIYRTAEGFLSISMMDVSRAEEFCGLLGIDDPHGLMPDNEALLRDRDRIFHAIQDALMENTAAYWEALLLEHSFWCAKLNEYPDVVRDPQVIHNGIIQEMEHPAAGRIRLIASAIHMSKTPPTLRTAPPLIGQHNAEIMGELGFSEAEIEELKEKRVFG